jgi:hypothetical protein
MLVLTPVPLVALLWLTGGVSAPAVMRGFGAGAAWAAVCLGAVWAGRDAAPAGSARAGGLGTGLAALALASRAAWIGWIGA